MSNRTLPLFVLAVFALVGAAVLFSLGAEFRPDGLLGELQSALQFMFVLPYLLGIALGGNVHAPSAVGVFLGLFAEVYGLALLIWWLMRRVSTSATQ
jgi:hypothetical protein